jgi:predicted GIY-YIG superfamily endonuclease
MAVYLIHISGKVSHAQHYIGYTTDIARRYREHDKGGRLASPLLRAAKAMGYTLSLARVWPEGDRNFERKLKNYKKARCMCPICKGGTV